MSMQAALRLFYHRGLYDGERTEGLFVRAMRENVEHHRAHCPAYAEILNRQGFSPDRIRTAADLCEIPPLPTLFLKRHTLLSTDKKLHLTSTTSGTSGQVSRMGLDWPSMWRGLGMVLGTVCGHKLLSPRPTNFVVLGYQPAKHNQIGAAKTAYAVTYTAPAIHRVYALRDTGNGYELNLDGLKEALISFEKSGRPVRLMGFPSYFFFLLRELQRDGVRLRLHRKSLVILAGGWKQFLTDQVEKPALYALSKEVLGIGEERIREFFGAVEHPIAYADCPHHHFHVPIYSRVIIRDERLHPVGYGTPGLLNLLTPMMTSMPFSSVITDDLAVLYPGEACGCGIRTPYFEVLGRVGLAGIRTCAAGASELLSVLQKGGTG